MDRLYDIGVKLGLGGADLINFLEKERILEEKALERAERRERGNC